MLVYSSGLRAGKVVKLKPEEIDSNRKIIHIKGAKVRKDRYTLLSDKILETLKKFRYERVSQNGWKGTKMYQDYT